ncbi:MAG: T9SS type A sorting domain-containing protein, partial [Flavobacteriales bacterium]
YGICAQLDVTGGNAPQDINWSLLYIDGTDTNVVVSGGAPFSSALCLPALSSDYRLVVSDAASDGWEGAVYTLSSITGDIFSAGTFNSLGLTTDTLFVSVGYTSGCTDPTASNFDSTAFCDNGTCTQCPPGRFPYLLALDNSDAANWLGSELYIIPNSGQNQDTLVIETFNETNIYGCLATGCYSIVINSPNSTTNATWVFEEVGAGTIYSGIANQLAFVAFHGANGCELSGCLLPSACNYNPLATTSDGTCIFPGCTDANACNFSATAGCDDGSCISPGCSDATACNYVLDAVCFDNSYCLFVDTDNDGVCDELEILGCSDFNACNYDAAVTEPVNGECVYPGCTDVTACNFNAQAGCDNGQCSYPGCFTPGACNYSTAAGCDDGSCVFPGCTDNTACNYDSNAGCADGSCEFDVEVTLNFEVDSVTLQSGLAIGDTVITTPGVYVVLTPSPNGCDSVIYVTIELQGLNGVSEYTQTGFKIWPNPANSFLNISSPEWAPINMEIMDALGRVVWSGPWLPQIPLFAISPGMYALRVTDGRNSELRRFEVVR